MENELFENNLYINEANGNTLLHSVAISGNIKILNQLSFTKENIDDRNNNDETPLILSVHYKHIEMIKELLKRGANIEAQDNIGATPLILAVFYEHIEIIKELLNWRPNINLQDKNGMTALSMAITKGNFEIVKILLDNGANINMKSTHSASPLHLAIYYNNIKIMKELLFRNVDVYVQDHLHFTPLHIAVDQNNQEAVEKLLSYKDLINMKNTNGDTALHIALEKGFLDIAEMLIKNGTNLNAKNIYNYTPLHMAVQKGHFDVIKLLLEFGINVNSQAIYGETALMIAINNNHKYIVKILIENGADLEIQSESGYWGITIALGNRSLEIVKILLDNFAQIPDIMILKEIPEAQIIIYEAIRTDYLFKKDKQLLSYINQVKIQSFNLHRLKKYFEVNGVSNDLLNFLKASTLNQLLKDELLKYINDITFKEEDIYNKFLEFKNTNLGKYIIYNISDKNLFSSPNISENCNNLLPQKYNPEEFFNNLVNDHINEDFFILLFEDMNNTKQLFNELSKLILPVDKKKKLLKIQEKFFDAKIQIKYLSLLNKKLIEKIKSDNLRLLQQEEEINNLKEKVKNSYFNDFEIDNQNILLDEASINYGKTADNFKLWSDKEAENHVHKSRKLC